MINVVVQYKENTLVVDLPRSSGDLALKLRSIGVRMTPEQVKLTDNEEDDLRVKVYGSNGVEGKLTLLLRESNSLADANSLADIVQSSNPYVRSELERKAQDGRYDSLTELYVDAINIMRQEPVTETFYFPLVGNIDEGDEDYYRRRRDRSSCTH